MIPAAQCPGKMVGFPIYQNKQVATTTVTIYKGIQKATKTLTVFRGYVYIVSLS